MHALLLLSCHCQDTETLTATAGPHIGSCSGLYTHGPSARQAYEHRSVHSCCLEWYLQLLYIPKLSDPIQKCSSYSANLKSETPGDSNNVLLHWGDVLALPLLSIQQPDVYEHCSCALTVVRLAVVSLTSCLLESERTLK